jgi:hypothetical protein
MAYSDDELLLLASVPQMIGSAVATASRSGLFGTGKELFASANSILEGSATFPNNALINMLVPDPKVDRTKTMEQAKKVRDWATARIKEKGINSPDKLKALALEDAKTAAALLTAKSSASEAAEYKQWAMSVAEKVANASTEGGFLGFGGERVTAEEKAVIEDIRSALGVA